MQMEHAHRLRGVTGHTDNAGLHTNRKDLIAELAGESIGEDGPVRMPGGEHAARINRLLGFEPIDLDAVGRKTERVVSADLPPVPTPWPEAMALAAEESAAAEPMPEGSDDDEAPR